MTGDRGIGWIRNRPALMIGVAMLLARCGTPGIDCGGPSLIVDVSSLSQFWHPGAGFTICADLACSTYHVETGDQVHESLRVSLPKGGVRPQYVSGFCMS